MWVTVSQIGRVRGKMPHADRQLNLGLADPNVFAYCWVVEFPLLEWDEDGQRWDATHNPFSSYFEEDEPLLDTASITVCGPTIQVQRQPG